MAHFNSFAALALATLLAGASARLDAADLETRERPRLGSEAASITVLEVTNFKCSHCRVFHEQVFPVLREQYIVPQKVKWIVLNASDDPSDQFTPIFAIARCAVRQGKYWEILDSLYHFANRPPSFLTELIGKNPRIDRNELELCLRDRTVRSEVAGDFAEYVKLKTKGTPTFIVTKTSPGGQVTTTTLSGGQKLEYFQRVLDELLKSP
jgi:protein-disulfide isomerase